MTAQSDGLHLADVYVTAIYDGHWWLASVTNVSTAEEEVHLNFLHPHGPSRSYFFTQCCDRLHVHIRDVITHVEPTTDTGRIYRIYPEETRQVEVIMQRKCTCMAVGRVGHLGHDEAMEAGGREFDPRPGHYSRMSF